MPRENRVSAAAPGLPANFEAEYRRVMDLSADLKLELARRLEAECNPDLIHLAAAIRRHVATEESEA